MRQRRRQLLFLATIASVIVALGACYSSPGISAVGPRLALDDLHTLSGCTGYGHSGMASVNVAPQEAFLTLVCDRYVGRVRTLGVPGSSLQSSNLPLGQTMPPDPPTH